MKRLVIIIFQFCHCETTALSHLRLSTDCFTATTDHCHIGSRIIASAESRGPVQMSQRRGWSSERRVVNARTARDKVQRTRTTTNAIQALRPTGGRHYANTSVGLPVNGHSPPRTPALQKLLSRISVLVNVIGLDLGSAWRCDAN